MRRDMHADLTKRRIKKYIRSGYFKVFLFFGFLLCYATWNGIIFQKNKLPPVNLKYVVVHLDFKRTPLKLDYLEGILDTLKDHGVNGLLMEYEDMFPFEGNLVNLSARNCYKKKDLKHFLIEAKLLGFEIIPVVQTFGHMEYALKLKEFEHLREQLKHDDSICPSKNKSGTLIMEMLSQVIKFHQSIFPLKYLHIGCDEVYHLASCRDCVKRNMTKAGIYLDHVTSVYVMVKLLAKDTKVLIWDDMLRTISPAKWRNDFHLPVEPVYWNYKSQVEIQHASLLNYHKSFPNIWIATAFKGADGDRSLLPNVPNRFLNHYKWLKLITNYKFGGETHVYNFKGIILTGWSRYNHNKPTCDLFPASMPSLVVNLLLIKEFMSGRINRLDMNPSDLFRKHIEAKLKDSLGCRTAELDFTDEIKPDHDRLRLDFCDFEGLMLYDNLKAYLNLQATIANGISLDKPPIGSHSKEDWCELMTNSIKFLENDMTEILRDYYEEDFIGHYVFEKIFPLKAGLKPCFD